MEKLYSVYRHISPSGKVYVGITCVPPNQRWRGGHGYIHSHQYLFANAIHKYGWDNFTHEILLEGRSKGEAVYAEKYLIKWYKMHGLSYNITDGGDIGGSLAGKDHPMYGRHTTNPMYGIRGGNNPNSIKVYQYTRDGVFVKAWDSIIEAAATFNNKSSAATGITACCKYKLPACKGYIWRYFFKNKLEEKAPIHTKEVYQYDITGALKNVYPQINAVQKELGVCRNALGKISSCCNGKSVSAFGYFWSFTKFEQYPIGNIKPQVITKMKKYLSEKGERNTDKKTIQSN